MSIASEITRLQTAKADLKTAIEGKGVTVSASALLDDYADLVDAISGGGGLPTITEISAVYTQSGVVDIKDDLSVLISDLVVTATINDTLQIEVAPTDYILSGTLIVGTSTITVSYGGQTDTFTVTVTQDYDYYWDYTDGVFPTGFVSSDSGGGGTATLTNNGLELYSGTASGSYVRISNTSFDNYTTKAKLLAEFSVDKTNNDAGFRLCVANGTKGAQTNTSSSSIRAFTNTTAYNCPILAYLEVGKLYTIELIHSVESGTNNYSVFVNGIEIQHGANANSMQFVTGTRLWSQGNGITATVKSIRYKKDY